LQSTFAKRMRTAKPGESNGLISEKPFRISPELFYLDRNLEEA